MSQRSALVTGANSGIGKATATALAKAGFDVTLAVRDTGRGEEAAAEIRKAAPSATVDILQVDLSSQKAIRAAAASFLSGHNELHVLVNAAGVFLKERSETEDGIERTFATNYIGYFLLTHELLPALRAAGNARIVNVASRYGRTQIHFDDIMIKTRKYTFFRAVAPTMVARVLFTQELAEQLKESGIAVNAVHPGLVKNTQLLKEVGGFFKWMTNTFGGTPEQGADTVVWLATAPEAAKLSGGLFAKRKPLKTPGQGSDPAARKQLWQESLRLTGLDSFALPHTRGAP